MIGLTVFLGALTLLLCYIDEASTEDVNGTTGVCSGPDNKTGEIRFRHNTNVHIFNKKEWMYLDCCVYGNFTEILWHYRTASNSSWQDWPWFDPCNHCSPDIPKFYQLCQGNQSLVMIDPLPSDSGNYRCRVSNSNTGEEIIREFTLVVDECNDEKEGGIQFIEEPDSLSQRVEKGSNVTFTCAGNFGCPTQDPLRLANWSSVNSSGYVQELRPHQNPRFKITYKKSFPYIVLSSTLTIVDVQDSDYSLVLTCSVSTSSLHRTYDLTLHRPEKIVELKLMDVIIAVCAAGSVTLVGVFLLSLYCCYKPVIHLRFSRLTGRHESRAPGQEDYHDACIIHSPVNKNFVEEEIKKPLLDENYDIFTEECVSEGESEIGFVNNIGKSMCAIIVLSKAEIEDHSISYLFSVAVATCGSKMVVIEKEDIKTDSWRTVIEGQEALKQLPNILKTVQWQGRKNMSRRQLGNFYAEIKRKLPYSNSPKGTTSRQQPLRMNSDSSTSPLMRESESTYPSLQSEKGTRNSSGGSHGLQTLSSSSYGETVIESEYGVNDEVFNCPNVIPKRSTQTQISRDSGMAPSI